MRIYLAGPMTNLPDHNKPAFRMAAHELREAGHEVISPVEMDEEDGIPMTAEFGDWDWCNALARDLEIVCAHDTEAVVVLPQWERSRGAYLETAAAYALGKPVYKYPSLEEVHYAVHPARAA